MFRFDLQLFGGGNGKGGQQTNTADQAYNQEIANANASQAQFMNTYWPVIQKLLPQLTGTLNGQNTALSQAAQAPVNAATGRALNTIQGSAGGVANPAALYEDISLNGQQQAGLAGDQMLQSSLSALQNLIGMGYGDKANAQQALNAGAGGEANLGQQLNQQANAPWEALLGAAGTYFGAQAGVRAMKPAAPTSTPFATGLTPIATAGNSYFGGLNAPANASATPFGTTAIGGDSGPISGSASNPYNPFGFGFPGG